MRGSADRAAPSTCSGVATPKYPIDIRVAGGLFEGDVELLDRATIVALADVCGRPVEDGERAGRTDRSEEHTSELQSPCNLVCRLLLEKKNEHKHLANTAGALPRDYPH